MLQKVSGSRRVAVMIRVVFSLISAAFPPCTPPPPIPTQVVGGLILKQDKLFPPLGFRLQNLVMLVQSVGLRPRQTLMGADCFRSLAGLAIHFVMRSIIAFFFFFFLSLNSKTYPSECFFECSHWPLALSCPADVDTQRPLIVKMGIKETTADWDISSSFVCACVQKTIQVGLFISWLIRNEPDD